MIAIIDYDAGNIKSIENALEFLGEEFILTRNSNELLSASHVILPGVGAFGEAMKKLTEYGVVSTIYKVIEKGIPFLGICLGMQLLFESSEEAPGEKGLCILPGKIVRFSDTSIKIPQIGWNSLSFPRETTIFSGIEDGAFVYFVHSYYLKADDFNDVAATSEYGNLIHAAVCRNNVYGCQFHPEKSSEVGLKIIKNFCEIGKST